MAKTVTAKAHPSQKDAARQQRKKQARREAKIMLKIERAKKDLQKAQKKLTQSRSNLETHQTHLSDLEAKLKQLRTPQDAQTGEQLQILAPQTSSGEVPELKPEDFHIQEAADEAYQEPLLMPAASTSPQADLEAIEAFHTVSITSVESPDDVASQQETVQTQEEEQAAQQVLDAQTNDTSEPAKGRSDLSTDRTTTTTSSEEQPPTQASSDASSDSVDEQSTSPEAISETDTTTPEEHTTRTSRRRSHRNTQTEAKESNQEEN